jgi:hypothetical protein
MAAAGVWLCRSLRDQMSHFPSLLHDHTGQVHLRRRESIVVCDATPRVKREVYIHYQNTGFHQMVGWSSGMILA